MQQQYTVRKKTRPQRRPTLTNTEPDNMTQDTTHRCGYVAMVGPANAGKSTMLNAYLGQKVAIVSAKPQTTRNQINGIFSRKDAQVVFLDTPGLHSDKGVLHKMLMHTTRQAQIGADTLLLVLDANVYARKPQFLENDLPHIQDQTAASRGPLVIALNKVDLLGDKSRLLPLMERVQEAWPQAEIFPTSALNGEGLPGLLDAVVASLPEAPPMYPEDQLSTLPVRFMAQEIIREKLFNNLRQELPYSVAVDIELWEEPEDLQEYVRIEATIYVARNTHKSMVIGKHGQMLKDIGSQARRDIEELIERHVFLNLWVKVRENWTQDPGFLRSLGFSS